MEVRFMPGCGVDDGERAEIEWVLSRIAVGEGPGRLVPPVHRVEVVRLITGGRSGAQVLEVRVQRGAPEVTEWHVAKLQDASAARAEWTAYHWFLAKAVMCGMSGSRHPRRRVGNTMTMSPPPRQ
ncbi:hypothetical protein OG616_36105 [Streptomyces antibioticus]|uniref:hypothetical protein n=1 Tax=Streptomyces antibioticus TaxID=1890 RepID=UPI00225484BD|nr:hypothetical protein [Streptomyces antibioticus]MCX5173429.1 hypothetical protein [Streptomyces antibioticus]